LATRYEVRCRYAADVADVVAIFAYAVAVDADDAADFAAIFFAFFRRYMLERVFRFRRRLSDTHAWRAAAHTLSCHATCLIIAAIHTPLSSLFFTAFTDTMPPRDYVMLLFRHAMPLFDAADKDALMMLRARSAPCCRAAGC